MAARFWWVMGQLWLVRARRAELRGRVAMMRAETRAGALKKKAEEFFQRIGGGDGC